MLKNLLIISAIAGLTLSEVSAMDQQALTTPDMYAILPHHMHQGSKQNWACSHKAAAKGVKEYNEQTQATMLTHMKYICPSVQELKQAWRDKDLAKTNEVEINKFLWEYSPQGPQKEDIDVQLLGEFISTDVQLVEFQLSEDLRMAVDVFICKFRGIKSNTDLYFIHRLKKINRIGDLKTCQLIGSKEIIENTKIEFLFSSTDSASVPTPYVRAFNGSLNIGVIPEDAKIGILCEASHEKI